MKKIFITGMSATGKSTIAQELKKRGIAIVDIDSIDAPCCDWYDKAGNVSEYHIGVGKQWLYDHKWICNFDKIKTEIEKYKDKDLVVTVGITSNQFDWLDYFDKIFLLQIDDKTQLKRLNCRTTNDFASDPDEQQYIIETKAEFEREMLAQGAIPLDGTLPVALIVDKILSQ